MSVAVVGLAVAAVGLVSAVVEVTGLAGTVALLVPFLILLAVIVQASRAPAPKPRSAAGENSAALRAIPDGGPAAAGLGAEDRSVPAKAPAAAQAATEAPLLKKIKDAEKEKASDEVALAAHYLALAKDELAAGRADPAADHLRASVGAAARGKATGIQAQARLELAELARLSGDLTTACEHWQIARGLFFELKQKTELAETEGLMRRHGCPTDWVLNDF